VSEHRFAELLGPYALGDLLGEEKRELERHLEACPECRGELERVRQTHDLLRKVAASGPRPELKARVLAGATGAETPPSLSGGRRRFWIPAAATLLVVAVLGVGLFQVIANDSSAGVPLTATALAPEASGEVRGERAGENIRIQLEVRGLPELREDEYYEMWYAREDGERISCGAFRPDPEGPTSVNFTTPINAKFYPEIEVTRQADDGNPQISGQKVLEGELPA
jgi:anti-sigma-K factor RskA